jgi:hypothetical protein
VGGLRLNSPVTCGSSTSHPAPSRRPRAVGAETIRLPGRARARAKARGCNLPLQRMFSSCRCSPPLPAAPACSGRRRLGSHAAEPSAIAPPHPRAASAGVRSPSVASLPVALCSPSSPSSPPMRCPGSGLLRSRRLSASKPLRPPWRSRGATASRHPAAGGEPASAATATCWRSKCETWPSHPYKGTRGARIVSARKGELMGSFREPRSSEAKVCGVGVRQPPRVRS